MIGGGKKQKKGRENYRKLRRNFLLLKVFGGGFGGGKNVGKNGNEGKRRQLRTKQGLGDKGFTIKLNNFKINPINIFNVYSVKVNYKSRGIKIVFLKYYLYKVPLFLNKNS